MLYMQLKGQISLTMEEVCTNNSFHPVQTKQNVNFPMKNIVVNDNYM